VSSPVEERPTRIDRGPAGVTGARSGSVSKERPVDEIQGVNERRRVTSPSRAMGARSLSIGQRGTGEEDDGGRRGRSDGNEARSTDRGSATGFRSPSRG